MATDLFDAAGQRFNLDPNLVRAVFQTESGGQFGTPDSSAGAMGGMQVMPQTYATVAQRYGLGSDPRDPVNNVMAGAAVLSENLDRYGNVPDALRAYNAGYDPSRWSNPQTLGYVGKVANAYKSLAASPADDTPEMPPDPPAAGSSYRIASANTGTATDAMPDPNASPGQTSPSSSPASLSDDDLHSMLTGSPSSAPLGSSSGASRPTASTSSAGAQPLSDDALHTMLTGAPAGSQAIGATTPPASAAASPATGTAAGSSAASPSAGLPQSGFLGGVTTAAEGVANLGDRISSYVDRNVPFMASIDNTVLPALGMSSADQSGAALTADIAARDKANANSLGYAGGKLAGDVAITAPAVSAGGALVGGALEAAPYVGNALSAVGDAVRALPGGDAVATTATRAATGAAQGATAGAVTSGQNNQPIGQQITQGAIVGAPLGIAAPIIGQVGSGIMSALRGGSITPETAQLASLAQNTYKIPLTAAQITSSPAVKYAASAASRVPLSGFSGDDGAAQAAFNRAVSQTMGEDATKITPAVMNAAKVRLGNTFDNIAAGNTFPADNTFVSRLAGVQTSAQSVLGDEATPVLNQIDNVLSRVDQNGNISGDSYQSLTSRGSDLDRAQSSNNPNTAFYAGQIRDALDDALSRGVPPDQQAALVQARSQYRAMKTIEPLVGKSVTGDISPPSLMTPVKSSYGDIAYTGGGQLGDLARIGQLMKEPPSSGTAERASTLATLGGIGATASGVIAGVAHPLDAAYVGGSVLGSAALARGANEWLGSPVVTNNLIARGLAGNPGPGPFVNALGASSVPAGTLVGQNLLAAPPPRPNALAAAQ